MCVCGHCLIGVKHDLCCACTDRKRMFGCVMKGRPETQCIYTRMRAQLSSQCCVNLVGGASTGGRPDKIKVFLWRCWRAG